MAREIEGELTIVPPAAGIGDKDDELHSINDTGKEIWRWPDGNADLQAAVSSLCEEYDADPALVRQDVVGPIEELLGRRIVVEKPTG